MAAGRTRYIVSYDISNPKRLRRVHKTVKAFGWSMQYSVFICDLDPIELLMLKQEIAEIIHHSEDSVAFINLGPPAHRGRECFEFMGQQTVLPTSGPTII
ncbi:MAG: CRISPR-associated endonuclease Cas2 [Acidimicrobiaceae bacterium]|nr:CRISPR-associated endonuclease Cas2 [Acidimicrobiaceae bacterium]